MGLKPLLKRALLLSITGFGFMQNTFHFSGRAVTLPAKRWEHFTLLPPSLMTTSTCVPKGWSSLKRRCAAALDPWKDARISIRQSSVNRAVGSGSTWMGRLPLLWQGVKHGGRMSVCKEANAAWGREGAGRVYPSGGLTTPQAEQGQPQVLVNHSQSAICFRKAANVPKRVLRS